MDKAVIVNFHLPDGDRNAGTVHLPDPTSRHPLLIYCHGWGEDGGMGEVQSKLAQQLLDRGAGLLQFAFYGRGETGGDFSGMTYGRWAENLAAIFAWALTQPWVDPDRVALFGFSSGSAAALRFAARDPRPRCVVSLGTVLGHFIGMHEAGGPAKVLLGHLDGLLQGGKAPLFEASFPFAFFRDFLENAPVHSVKNITCPVFFLEGTADNPYRRSDGQLGHLLRQAHGLKSRHQELEGGVHGLWNLGDERNRLIVDFLAESGFFSGDVPADGHGN